MRVRVLFFGVLKDITGRPEEELELPADACVGSVFAHYAGAFPRLREMERSILLARNQRFAPAAEALADGDEIALLPPVSGGASPDGHFFALTRDPIDTRALVARLLRGEDGAVVVFEGVARNNSRGRRTLFLDYECYEPMALRLITELGCAIAHRLAIGRIAIVHRLGRLEIGEASVAVVVTAPHRQPAFEAAREAIDTLKRTVPIWKKEHFEDGEVWVEGAWDNSLAGHSKAAALLFAALAPLRAQQQPAYHVDVQLVRVLATVKDDNGQVIASLGKTDFQISDNGIPQELKIFEHHTEQPLSIAVMIDTSASTGIDLKYEVDSVNRFFNALFKEGNPDDAAALLAFNWETTLVTDFTHSAERLERGLRGIRSEGGTSLYDAICLASASLDNREGRHVIIVVTDGGDTTSVRTYHAALKAAQLADVVLYPVLVVPITNDPGRNTGGEHALTSLAEGTGGRVFSPTLGAALDAAFLEIIRDLRTQYLLAYYPTNVPPPKDPFHRVEVKVKRPGLRVSARSGYYGETEDPKDSKGWRRVK